jgi:hypothetical protein
MGARVRKQLVIEHDDLGFSVRVRSRDFAHLEGPAIKCDDRQRVVIPDQLSAKDLRALGEMFSAASHQQRLLPEDDLIV